MILTLSSCFSSAPEQTDELSLHIRVVGHWTSKLYEYFEAEQKRLEFTMNGETPEVSTEQDLPCQSDECTYCTTDVYEI